MLRVLLMSDNSQFIYIIGGLHNDIHYMYDITKKTSGIQEMHTFKGADGGGWYNFGCVYVSRRKTIYFIGGSSGYHGGYKMRNQIRTFSLDNNKWNEMKINGIESNFGKGWSDMGAVVTYNQRDMILLGGNRLLGGLLGEIYIVNIDKKIIRKSTKILPFRGGCNSILMRNELENDFLCNGYLRENTGKVNLPLSLMKLITLWHSMESIHFIQNATGKHWKIRVDDLLSVDL